jgi:UDP-N-acetylmuramoyl-tripeptide--D-alanyl-D-alanine ligase
MLARILTLHGAGLKTAGNLNNLVGLPQMVFRLADEHHWAVFEMGMSEFGEIDRLAEIASPEIGIITNVYPAHLETLGSISGVARAKGEMFLRLPTGGTAVYNADDELVSRLPVPAGVKRIGFGLHGAEVTAFDIRTCGVLGQNFRLQIGTESREIMLRAFGQHNIYNALAAAAAAAAAGISLDDVAAGLAEFTPYDKRFSLEDLQVVLLVDDSYNANPASVGAAFLTARELKGDRRCIAVLGDMLELGDESLNAHRDVGRLAATCVDRLYLYGEISAATAIGALEAGMPDAEVIIAATHEEIVADIIKDHTDGDMIVVKGSRGMRMDLVAAALRENFSGAAYQIAGRR